MSTAVFPFPRFFLHQLPMRDFEPMSLRMQGGRSCLKEDGQTTSLSKLLPETGQILAIENPKNHEARRHVSPKAFCIPNPGQCHLVGNDATEARGDVKLYSPIAHKKRAMQDLPAPPTEKVLSSVFYLCDSLSCS